MTGQLPLGLRWPSQQRFERFQVGANGVAVELLRQAARAPAAWLYLAGAAGSGRTHLLLATCAKANQRGRSAQYLALGKLPVPRANAIRRIGGSALLAIDDVETIAGDAHAEHALFDLYNRSRAESATLLFAALAPAPQLGIGLPDLVSRLAACTQLMLRPLDEIERRAVLRDRAQQRGIELDDGALDWLFTRRKRDLATLLELLDCMDRASLATQRRITVPFLRTLLSDET